MKDETRICEGRFTLVDFCDILVIPASLDSENSTSLAFKHIGKSENRFIIFRYKIRVRFPIQNLWRRVLFMLCYVIHFICLTIITKNKEKERKKKWRGDLTETIGACERFGLLELRVRDV